MADAGTPVSDNVAKRSTVQFDAAKLWELPRALMGGTKAMRKAGEAYLPKEEGESQDNYNKRRDRSTLFNGFRKTVADMTGKVFQREVTLEKDVPETLKTYAENIDLTGRHLNVFARDVFYDTLQTGVSYLLVDMPPKVERADGKAATVADEQGIRPYLVHIIAENMLGWKSETVDGAERLTQVRIKECVEEDGDDDFSTKFVDQVRVLYAAKSDGSEGAKWETYRQIKEKWTLYETGTTSVSEITLVPVYAKRTGFMTGAPPLEDLADLNVAHWQSQSDQRNILHFARVPILFGAGWPSEDKLALGSSTMLRNSDKDSTLQWVEISGGAIGAGDKDLENLEFQMQTQGLQLLVPKPGGETATGEIRDNAKENSPLAMMASGLSDALESCFGFMAEYDGLGEDKGGSVDVNTDFGVAMIGAADLPVLLQAVNSGQLSRQTFWEEMKRRDVLSDSFDAEVEQGRLDEQPPTLDAKNAMDLTAAKVDSTKNANDPAKQPNEPGK